MGTLATLSLFPPPRRTPTVASTGPSRPLIDLADPASLAPSPCRRCRREEQASTEQLEAARAALASLEDLLEWLKDEHQLAHLSREQAESEAAELHALIGEFQEQAATHAGALERASKAIHKARRERDAARAETDRYKKYVHALEDRLRRLADAPEGETGPRRSTRRSAARPASAGLARTRG